MKRKRVDKSERKLNCAQPCCLKWLSHIGGEWERAATAHNAHLSEHFLLQTHSLCTMHTMSICLNISLWQNIHFALCKKKTMQRHSLCTLYTDDSLPSLQILHFTFLQCTTMCNVWTWWMWDTWREWQFSAQTQTWRPIPDFIHGPIHIAVSSGNTALWQMGWVKLLGSSSHLRFWTARIFQIQGSPCAGSVLQSNDGWMELL